VTSLLVPFRHLVVIHYHLRPGGVRRVMEKSLPLLLAAGCSEHATVTFAFGGTGVAEWEEELRQSLAPHQVRFLRVPAFGYFSESRLPPARRREKIRQALADLVPAHETKETLIWTHNMALGRNLILADEIVRWVGARGLALISQHHDFWFENRWGRWKEMRQSGYRTLADVARVTFGGSGAMVFINRADQQLWKRHLPQRTVWVPNAVSPPAPPTQRRLRTVKGQLAKFLGDDGPLWVVPTRFLRRKNLAEAVLLTRWLRPEAWLLTTAGISSAGEQSYARGLSAAARRGGWRVRFGILSGSGGGLATIDEMIAAAEVILLTSVQEGFGLPILEAAAAGKPLVARKLPRLQQDFCAMGIDFPQGYDEVSVPRALFDWPKEQARQRQLWRNAKAALPAPLRGMMGAPLEEGSTVPFSRLTLDAQLEILALPIEESWAACRDLNPYLVTWRSLAAKGQFEVAPWPTEKNSLLASKVMIGHWRRAVLQSRRRAADPKVVADLQNKLINRSLNGKLQFPVLME